MSSSQPAFSTIRFVQTTGQPSGTKKRIAAKACDYCRRRKKRCFHAPENQEGSANAADEDCAAGDEPIKSASESRVPSSKASEVPGGQKSTSARRMDQPGDKTTPLSGYSVTSTHSAHPRFIGDLNPAVELLTATTPSRQPKNNVGVWHTEAAEQSHHDGDLNLFSPLSLFSCCDGSRQSQLQAFVRTQCLDVRPSWQEFEILEAFYFENVHPILPCVDKDVYWSSPVDSPARFLQQQIISLITCPNPSLKGLLKLAGSDGPILPADFARKTVAAMRLSLEMSLVADKTVVIQALTAMSLVAFGRESLELTPQFFIRAVQHGYTIGLHQPGDAQRNERTAGLFCSVWSMDRLHAAMQGRPVIMHEVDMAKIPQEEAAAQQPGFRVLVSIAMLLDKVIGLYRPGASTIEIPDEGFASFEEILENCSAVDLPARLIATLELFYHAVAILSCRYSSGPLLETHQARNNRQASSAMQILSIMEDADVSGKLVIMPWVPYAISLSLSAAYSDLRHSKAATHRSRARQRLSQAHQHLQPLGQVFWSAAFVAEMAGRILNEKQVVDGTVSGASRGASRRPSITQYGEQALPENLVDSTTPFEASQPLLDVSNDWNFDDLDGFLEGNLDPSVSWFPQDLQSLFSTDLQ